MQQKFPTLITAAALILSACGSNVTGVNSSRADSVSADSLSASVETKAPNSTKTPAFSGQTRIASVKTTTAFESKVLTSGLKSPWGIASLPDGRLLITEKGGTMKIVTKEGAVGLPLTGIPAVNAKGQGGLLGITIDPSFAQNRMVYWAFSEPVSGGNHTSLAKGKLSADEKSIENATVIYRATPAYNGNLHFGGRVIFDNSGNLLLSTGERSDKVTRPQAQDPKSALGKVIRLTREGRPASGNPVIDPARQEIYSYGHRNVQGLAIHPVTGDIWEGEFGPRGGDEINLVQPGKNYGWPIVTYGIEY
ncbi:PQQ-dependent sugar dehydrogenase, partial [Daejeonella sp.]|uniref:PQQ-dependent sugar dehydrogenase n=1 Tax=Daejeonella sp. TaxID=2805397 RepID=UPI0030C5BCB9